MIKGKFYKEKNMYNRFSDTFKAIVNKPVPLKGENCTRIKCTVYDKAVKKGNNE